jgi:hypothetical protein
MQVLANIIAHLQRDGEKKKRGRELAVHAIDVRSESLVEYPEHFYYGVMGSQEEYLTLDDC